MARVKRGVVAHARHKKVLKLAKGYKGARSKVYRVAKQAVIKAGQYAYIGRKQRKRRFRSLWITKINAAARLNNMSAGKARNMFYIYAGLMGLSLSSLLLVYTGESVIRVFFITSAAFASLSIYGYTTKKNLSAFGSFLIMGVIGIMIASIVNIFLGSEGLAFIISILGVLIFAGLTAYDTQKIKNMYLAGDDMEISGKKTVMGALTLYLDFILMFQFLLMFLGNRE